MLSAAHFNKHYLTLPYLTKGRPSRSTDASGEPEVQFGDNDASLGFLRCDTPGLSPLHGYWPFFLPHDTRLNETMATFIYRGHSF